MTNNKDFFKSDFSVSAIFNSILTNNRSLDTKIVLP